MHIHFRSKGKSVFWAALFLLSAGLIAGCASVDEKSILKSAGGTFKTGLVDDYALLPREKKEGVRFLRTAGIKMDPYSRVLIEKPELYFDAGARPGDMNPDELAQIKNTFVQQVTKILAKSYRVVNGPGKGVIRLRTAFTHLKLGSQTTAALGANNLLSNSLFVGNAAFEAELLDAGNNRRISAYVDGLAGKRLKSTGVLSRWPDVEQTLKTWSPSVEEALNLTFNDNPPPKK